MSWFDKIIEKAGFGKKIPKPEVTWIECKQCQEKILPADKAANLHVCPKCDFHFRITAGERIVQLINRDSFQEEDRNLISSDPLKFKDKIKYKDRVKALTKTGDKFEAIICGTGMIGEHKIEICAFDFFFMGGSMGSVVGEKITRSIERAIQNKRALIIICCSGGARMQEGILSLMQMAKTSSALEKLAQHKLPYISVLTDPTTGGVSASFAMLGDIILAEPGALVGFAGPRVIEQTIKEKLPEGFQRSEFLLAHGLIDQVVHRKNLRATLDTLLSLLKNNGIHKSVVKPPAH